MEQWTGSKLQEGYVNTAYCDPAYLTSVQSTSCEMLDWMKIVRRNNNLRYTDDTTLMAESEEELKSLLIRMREESEKAG